MCIVRKQRHFISWKVYTTTTTSRHFISWKVQQQQQHVRAQTRSNHNIGVSWTIPVSIREISPVAKSGAMASVFFFVNVYPVVQHANIALGHYNPLSVHRV